ncbi:MAG TPA: LamG domain-containing protein, partial [Candidatus Sulfotelmatobacter sp.]|nr:LamG domain-containing protein [Candidatus Sulfotelmatobacter sp.]
ALSGGTLWRPSGGIRAGALQFNGNNTQVVVPDAGTLDNTPAFTLAYWFWSAAFAGETGGLVSKRDGLDANEAYATYLNRADQHLYVDINGNSSRFASQALIRNGAWYHVAVVFDGSLPPAQRSQLWINGQLDTVALQSTAVLSNYSSNLRLGNTEAGAANWFAGSMDDVRFYRRALRPEEIAALAAVSLAPTNLTAMVGADLLDLSWPADHLGWQLQVQTNSNLIGLGTNWTTLPTSVSTNRLSLPINPANGSVFYRLFIERF